MTHRVTKYEPSTVYVAYDTARSIAKIGVARNSLKQRICELRYQRQAPELILCSSTPKLWNGRQIESYLHKELHELFPDRRATAHHKSEWYINLPLDFLMLFVEEALDRYGEPVDDMAKYWRHIPLSLASRL